MDVIEFIGRGICHQSPSRTFPGAWLCFRCTALYGFGFLGVALSGVYSRRVGLRCQLALAAFLILPVVIEKLVIRAWMPDSTVVRIVTGGLAGLGLGLFVGARSIRFVRWPEVPQRVIDSLWIAVLIAAVLGVAMIFLDVPLLLDLLSFSGVVAIALVSTAWALGVLALGGRRVFRRGGKGEGPQFELSLLGAFVVAELLLFALLPSHYRPSYRWILMLMG